LPDPDSLTSPTTCPDGTRERRLARPGLADEPDNLPGRHDEVDSVGGDVRVPPGAVPHGHALEPQLAHARPAISR
jgi:hypothetical protein